MNYPAKLKNIYNSSFSVNDIDNIPERCIQYAFLIGDNSYKQKGVYTVLITLLIYKSIFPMQDIRKHQSSMPGGFSGRTIDFQFITPTLKELGLPSMAESGWLTRSLEQPYPYNLDYPGKISSKGVKEAFLYIIDYIQHNPECTDNIVRLILNRVIELRESRFIKITPLSQSQVLTIHRLVWCLTEHFSIQYGIRGGSKLPVLAIYALYKSLIKEIKRYEKCTLGALGSHTASDLKSRSSGDIEVFDEKGNVFETVEVKHNKEIDINIMRIAYEKIKTFNPQRYYILSSKPLSGSRSSEIDKFVNLIKNEHGCQVIVNGVIPTLKYYLRLISLENFLDEYSELVNQDSELQSIHQRKWIELIQKSQSDELLS